MPPPEGESAGPSPQPARRRSYGGFGIVSRIAHKPRSSRRCGAARCARISWSRIRLRTRRSSVRHGALVGPSTRRDAERQKRRVTGCSSSRRTARSGGVHHDDALLRRRSTSRALEVKLCGYASRTRNCGARRGWPLYLGGASISALRSKPYAQSCVPETRRATIRPRRTRRGRAAMVKRWCGARSMCLRRLLFRFIRTAPGGAGSSHPGRDHAVADGGAPFHLDKVAYWSRTVMVPLFILCTPAGGQKSRAAVHIPELFHDLRPNRKSITSARSFHAADAASLSWRGSGRLVDRAADSRPDACSATPRCGRVDAGMAQR